MKIISRLFTFLVFLFLYAPIFVLIAFSFNASKSRVIWGGFTFKWYGELLQDKLIMGALSTTLIVALCASLLATVIGTAAAVGIHNMKKRPRQAMLMVNNIPVMNPDIITGVSLSLLFLFLNIEMGIWTLILAHMTFNIPYVILSVMPRLRQLNRHTYEAALDLGANPMTAFFKVIIPEIMPGIVNGLMLSFTLSLDDFVISYFTSGSKAQTLAMAIYGMTRRRVTPEINALSTLLFVAVLTLLIVINVRQNKDLKKEKVRI